MEQADVFKVLQINHFGIIHVQIKFRVGFPADSLEVLLKIAQWILQRTMGVFLILECVRGCDANVKHCSYQSRSGLGTLLMLVPVHILSVLNSINDLN